MMPMLCALYKYLLLMLFVKAKSTLQGPSHLCQHFTSPKKPRIPLFRWIPCIARLHSEHYRGTRLLPFPHDDKVTTNIQTRTWFLRAVGWQLGVGVMLR